MREMVGEEDEERHKGKSSQDASHFKDATGFSPVFLTTWRNGEEKIPLPMAFMDIRIVILRKERNILSQQKVWLSSSHTLLRDVTFCGCRFWSEFLLPCPGAHLHCHLGRREFDHP